MNHRPPAQNPSLYDTAITEAVSRDGRLNEVAQLLMAIGRALHTVGQPAHRVERTLMRCADRFHVPLQVFIVPTGQFISFLRDDGPLTFVLRENPGTVDLARLSELMRVADAIVDGKLTPLAARAKIDKIVAGGDKRSDFTVAAAYALSAAPFSVFFGGGWTELIVSSCVGLAVGLVAVVMRRLRSGKSAFELVAATAAAFIAGSADEVLGAYGGWIPLAAGLIVLLPGIALVDALEELAAGHLTSGSSRLAGVGVVFLALTFGSVIGYAGADYLPRIKDVEPAHLPEWFVVPALLVVAWGSTLRFRARAVDWWVILLASALALVGSRFGKAYMGPLAGSFFGALVLGIAGRLYARFTRHAVELMVVPGIAMLVPGSVGYRSLELMLSQDTDHGVEAAFQMFLIAMALVAGLLFSDALVSSRSNS